MRFPALLKAKSRTNTIDMSVESTGYCDSRSISSVVLVTLKYPRNERRTGDNHASRASSSMVEKWKGEKKGT